MKNGLSFVSMYSRFPWAPQCACPISSSKYKEKLKKTATEHKATREIKENPLQDLMEN